MASSKSSSLDELLASQLTQRKDRGLFRSLQSSAVEQGLVDFSSNDYLSLSRNQDIKKEYISLLQGQLQKESAFRLGSGGSRLLDGNSSLAETLERNLAHFHGAPAGLLFNSGYEANTGLFSAVPQAGDVVVYDEFIHASVHSGMKLSRASRCVKFRHNSVWATEDTSRDNPLASLEETLRRIIDSPKGGDIKAGRNHVFVAVEALYSMDGDLAPLDEIVRCVEEQLPLGNGHIIVDEAHSNGVFGPEGRGLVCELGLEKRIWATVLTFGKAMGCSGGKLFLVFPRLLRDRLRTNHDTNLVQTAIVLCTPTTRSYLINYARSFIYTTAMGFPALASIQTAHSYVASGRADPARRNLFALIRYMRVRLTAICDGAQQHSLLASPTPIVNTGCKTTESSSCSPIIPIFTAKARSLAAFCRNKGYMVRPIVAPTVPLGTDRVRICLHAGNTMEECEGLCEAIEAWVRERNSQAVQQSQRIGHASAVNFSEAAPTERHDNTEKARL